MKKPILVISFIAVAALAYGQREYKTTLRNDSDSFLEIQIGSKEVTIIGHDKDEVVITTDFVGEYVDDPAERKEDQDIPERAAGLRPITVSASDNTGIGFVVEKHDDEGLSVLKMSKTAVKYSYKFYIPNRANLMINDIHAEVNTTYIVNDYLGEVEVNALNSQIKMNNVSGPVVANATNGNVEISFVDMDPDKPCSILSVNGFVDVSLPGNTEADLQLHTVNGEAYTDWDIEVDKDASAAIPVVAEMNMFNIEGSINGGGIPISIQSVNGDIFLRKK